MAKYKNIKQFSKPISLAGKRYVLKPNEVIFSDRELDLSIYDFLEKVDDKATVSPVKEIVKQTISVPSANTVKNLQNKLEDVKKDVLTLQSTPKEVSEAFAKIDTLQKTIDTVLKRLEVMKSAVEETNVLAQDAITLSEETASAVKTLEQEVYENGGIIITGADEEEQQKG